MAKDWDSEGEVPHSRIYSSRGPRTLPYQNSQSRYPQTMQSNSLQCSPRGYSLSVHDPQHSDQDSEQETKSQRKRIPVACGRCRKRKIRCSGPQGDSGCVNCKNAGNSDCQFNRVSSSELILQNTDFSYNPDIARAVHARESRSTAQSVPFYYRPQTSSYIYGPSFDTSPSYRSHHISDFYHPSKPSLPLSSRNFFDDNSADYTLSSVTSPLDQEHAGGPSNYGSRALGRLCLSGTQPPKGSTNALYFDSDVAGHPLPSTYFNNQAGSLRSPTTSDPNHFSLTGMASSLPMPSTITVSDRILPPVTNRFNAMLTPMPRAMDETNDGGRALKAIGNNHLAVSQLMTGGHASNSSYLPDPGSSESDNSYNPNGLSGGLSSQQTELYSSLDNWAATALNTDPALRSEGPSSDIYHGYGNDGSRKVSQLGQSSASNTLLSGHAHQAPYSHQDTPPISRNNSTEMSRVSSNRRSYDGLPVV